MTETTRSDAPALLHVTECLASGTLSFLELATRELARAGVHQTLLFSRRPDTPAQVETRFESSVQLVELPALTAGSLPAYAGALRRALHDQLQQREYRAVHFHSSKAGFIGRLVSRGLGRPMPPQFYSPHGLAFLDDSRAWKPAVFRSLERLAARWSRCTPVGCSRGEAALLDALGGRRAQVLENAIDDVFFHVRAEGSQPPLVISIGRACYQKAPERFAQMAARFRIAEVPARFVWVGAGDAASETLLRAAGVEVTGWVERAQVIEWLRQASVYAQTSRWEGMPLAVLQALGSGLPCVVTDVVGNRDAVRQGITGFVCADDDSMVMGIKRLLGDEALRVRMSLAARADAMERFGHRGFRARLCALYGVADADASVASGGEVAALRPFGRPAVGVPASAAASAVDPRRDDRIRA